MTQEEKDLLLKDLCGRIPYGVMCHTCTGDFKLIGVDEHLVHLDAPVYEEGDDYYYWEHNIKMYLRPMSSMTEEELEEYGRLWHRQYNYPTELDIQFKTDLFDWLNKNHFDYRGLIGKELALAVTKENNPYV